MKAIKIILSEIASIKQKKKDLKNFGTLFFFVCLLLATLVYYKHGWQTNLMIEFSVGALCFLTGGFLTTAKP